MGVDAFESRPSCCSCFRGEGSAVPYLSRPSSGWEGAVSMSTFYLIGQSAGQEHQPGATVFNTQDRAVLGWGLQRTMLLFGEVRDCLGSCLGPEGDFLCVVCGVGDAFLTRVIVTWL